MARPALSNNLLGRYATNRFLTLCTWRDEGIGEIVAVWLDAGHVKVAVRNNSGFVRDIFLTNARIYNNWTDAFDAEQEFAAKLKHLRELYNDLGDLHAVADYNTVERETARERLVSEIRRLEQELSS